MPSTLRHFLSVSLEPGVAKPAMVLAAEKDPAILVALLSSGDGNAVDLARWHEDLEAPVLQAAAIALANESLVGSSEIHDQTTPWMNSLTHSLLAEAMARHIGARESGEVDITCCRLTGLLSGIGRWLDPSGDGRAGDHAAADLLANLGCSSAVCDAVRYHHEPLADLSGVPLLLRVNALAGHLVSCVGGPQLLPAELAAMCGPLTGLTEDEIYQCLGEAGRTRELTMDALGATGCSSAGHFGQDCLTELVTHASIGAAFYRALVKAAGNQPFDVIISRTGRFLFGFEGLCHFRPEAQDLVGQLPDGEWLRVGSDRQHSEIARCRMQNEMAIVTRMKATDLIERQLLGRFDAGHLICLPLGAAGVLVGGIDQSFAENIDRHSVLLRAFAEAASDLYLDREDTDVDAVPLPELHRRVREITHEVNNPLAIVQNYLRTLSIKSGEDSPLQKDIDAISREITRVGGIVQKYARIGTDDSLVLQRVDLNGLVEELAAIVQGGHEDLAIDTRLDPSIPMMELAGDALRQVILNLLKNAAEALGNVADARIHIATQGAVNMGGKHYLEVVISDNGPGMSQEQRLGLFAGDASTKGEGRGLGLGIVRQLLDEMSGIISCRENVSVPGESGTSFQILLPVG